MEKEDMFVGMAYHSESFETRGMNGMVVFHNNEFPLIPRSLPSGSVDRQKVLTIEEMKSAWNNAASEVVPVSVDVTLTRDVSDPNLLHAEASAAFIRDLEDAGYVISIALVADNMKNPLWKQNNGFSGSTNPACSGELWEIFTKGKPYVEGLTFNDVVVSYPDKYGIEGSLPQSIEAGVKYSANCDFNLAQVKNIWGQSFITADAKLRAVAMVMDKESGEVVNCISSPYVSDSNGVETVEAEPLSVECWDVAGNRVSPYARGLQIRRIRYSDGSVKTVKRFNP